MHGVFSFLHTSFPLTSGPLGLSLQASCHRPLTMCLSYVSFLAPPEGLELGEVFGGSLEDWLGLPSFRCDN